MVGLFNGLKIRRSRRVAKWFVEV